MHDWHGAAHNFGTTPGSSPRARLSTTSAHLPHGGTESDPSPLEHHAIDAMMDRLEIVKLLFAGTPEIACPALAALDDDPRHDVVAVLTRPDAAVGRHRTARPSPVAALAHQRGIRTIKATSVRTGAGHDEVAGLDVDAAVVVAYGGLVPADLLKIPEHGWINLHFSLLPRWRGAAPVQRAIMAGDERTGACVFQLVPELDAGAVHASMTTAVGPTETSGELLERLAADTTGLIATALDRMADGIDPTPQPEQGVTHAAKITPQEARIDPSLPARTLDRLIRGTSPAPGAWGLLDGRRFKILRTCLVDPARSHEADLDSDLAPGELHATKNNLYLGTGEGVLRLMDVQAFGKKAMHGADWARGAHPNGKVLS